MPIKECAYMTAALAKMIEIAAPIIGRETDLPILSDPDDGVGEIDYGELEVIESEEPRQNSDRKANER